MQRQTVLTLLWFLLTVMIQAAHARHNITAALVALAPVSDTDIETSLNVADKDGNTGSIANVNWILISSALILQLLAFLFRWVWEKEKLLLSCFIAFPEQTPYQKDSLGNYLFKTQFPCTLDLFFYKNAAGFWSHP